jgi:hypothetical protein
MWIVAVQEVSPAWIKTDWSGLSDYLQNEANGLNERNHGLDVGAKEGVFKF